jgi:hypothetical protein
LKKKFTTKSKMEEKISGASGASNQWFARRTGLSACIFFACGKKGYRFYPLRTSPGPAGCTPQGIISVMLQLLRQSGRVVAKYQSGWYC